MDEQILVGEICHIVSRKPGGPRGNQSPPGGAIDGQANIILLCPEHHTMIDRQPDRFPVPKLVQWKKDHQEWVDGQFASDEFTIRSDQSHATEIVYSSLMPVKHIPRFVYVGECSSSEAAISQELLLQEVGGGVLSPFIIREGNLLTFCDLDDEANPFRTIVDPYSAEKHHADTWWDDPDQSRWYVDLLNRSLNKLTGRLGLNLDKEHRRYYFEPGPDSTDRKIEYTTMGGRHQSRNVAWQPRVRATGERKHYWEHLAVGLQFHRTGHTEWCLSIRPERRFTRDGEIPLTRKGIGRRSTSKKSRMYNFDVLGEIHFWRDFLSRGAPRVSRGAPRAIMKFGRQSLIVDAQILDTEVTWPTIPEDSTPHMKAVYLDDLVSLADYNEAVEFEDHAAMSVEAYTESDLPSHEAQ